MACQLFQKKYVNGLYTLCGYLMKYNLSSYISNAQYHEQSTSESILDHSIIDNIVTEFFGFEGYCEKQWESILSFLSG